MEEVKVVSVEVDVIKEIYKLLDYNRCMAMATGYKGIDKPNLDFISRKLSECLKNV